MTIPDVGRVDDVDLALEEAEDIEWQLKLAQHHVAGKCWAIEYVDGPHPGCAEFAPPEVHMCHAPGEHWVLGWDYDYGPPVPDWELYCKYHTTKAAKDDALSGVRTTTAKHG